MTNQQKQELLTLARDAYMALEKIQESPLFSQVEYSPDLTIPDAKTALEYLAWELTPDPLDQVNEC